MASNIAQYALADEKDCVDRLLSALPWDDALARSVGRTAEDFVRDVRAQKKTSNDLEGFFQHYGLDTKEGLALMCMAEALLRIPDTRTATALIRDKVAATNWLKSGAQDKDFMAKAAGLGLSLTSSTMNSLFSKMGEPVIRNAMMQAMRLMGRQFVIGQSIENALTNATKPDNAPYRMSYDMLGEAARTAADAERYFESYRHAIETIGERAPDSDHAHGISVKLSALHPRYEFAHRDACVPMLADKLIQLCNRAAQHGMTLTIDAEESERLEISLRVLERTLEGLRDDEWEGLGLAVQAYQKRAHPLLDTLAEISRMHKRRLRVRLVKGAYWDTEIKRAQVLGLQGYPVFTRKCNTDLSYLACAHKMLQHPNAIKPLFATHNAHSIMAVAHMARGADIEFQKLFGMGNALYRHVLEEDLGRVSVYAPVGVHEDLLPYLVRRLLENGANSSFVRQIYDESIDADDLVTDPVAEARGNAEKSHPKIPLPANIYGPQRRNSKGIDLDDHADSSALLFAMDRGYKRDFKAIPIIAGKDIKNLAGRDICNPANKTSVIGYAAFANQSHVNDAFETAKIGHQIWSQMPANVRADTLRRAADALEDNMAELMMMCVKEAGKTVDDARDEVREAVDFCRYYANEGEALFNEEGIVLQGPTGESNVYRRVSRGVFVCISPWNFPLAIFTGQIAAALMAGNAVIAKPAEQTPCIAYRMVRLMLECGVPREALTLLPGVGNIGAALVQHKDVAGVVFTGSTETAWSINRSLAVKDGPIAALIAETGGQNAFIADSSALPEQVVDDVIHSAFGSAGQRCSAARVLFVQDDAADHILDMISGAMAELRMGDPFDLATDVGPVIDQEALKMLRRHKRRLDGIGRKIAEVAFPSTLDEKGYFFAPCAYEIDSLDMLDGEVFGPVLHIIRYEAEDLDAIVDQINDTGYGLTLGVHSRIDSRIKRIVERARVGNIYVNRGTTGAVVGVQPFGGRGLSGTGPKAGGPDYLAAFATEKHVSEDITASGGNASLVMLTE